MLSKAVGFPNGGYGLGTFNMLTVPWHHSTMAPWSIWFLGSQVKNSKVEVTWADNQRGLPNSSNHIKLCNALQVSE